MSRYRPLFLALAAVVLTLGVWWVASLGEPAPPLAPSPAAGKSADEAELRTSAPPELSEDAHGAHGALPQVSPPERTGRTQLLSDEEEALLAGRIVDSSASPVAGARIEAVRRGAIELEHLGDPGLGEERPVARTTSGEDGRFEIRLALGRPHCLKVTAEGFAPTVTSNVYAGENVTIAVRRGASVSGRVTRKEDEVPVAGARVVVERQNDSLTIWEGTTDEAGRYSAQGIDPGQNDLEVIPIEECRERATLDLKEGDAVVRDLQVSFGLIVTGEVKSRETGLPIAGAEVGSELFRGKVASTDAAGRYALTGLLEAPVLNLSVRADGYGAYETSLQPGVDRILTANFELTRGRVASGRVVGRDGDPVAGAYVAALSRSIDRGGLRTDRVSARTGADGRFRLAGLRSDLPHTLLVRRERFASGVLRSFDARPEVDIELGDVVLRPGASLSGRVVSPDARPIPEAWLDLATSDPSYSDPSLGLGRRNLRTGSEGRFHFLDLPPGRHVLQVFVEGLETEVKVEFDLAEGEAKRDVEVVAGSGKMIRGRVLDPEGHGLEGADLLLQKPGDETGASAVSGPDGSFQFAGLGQGAYVLTAGYAELYGSSTERYELAETTLPGVMAGTSDLRIPLRRAAEITGQVVAPEGTGIAYALVVAVDRNGVRLDGRTTDREGRFRLRVAADATVELRAWRTRVNPATGRGLWADETTLPEAMQSGVRAGELEISLVIVP